MAKEVDANENIEATNELNFVDGNNIFIHGDFNDTISKKVVPQLIKEIEKQKQMKDGILKFYINSDGGWVSSLQDLLALVEIAKKNNIVVETYVFGRAYSCGSLLACAGTKGHRYISYNAEHLCHLGYSSTGTVRNDIELGRNAERVQNHFNKVRLLYKKYANVKNLDEVIMHDDYYIRGNDIIENGLADKYVD